tara:strand:- start:23289 stop:24314 length:1026 start_codon:yes stop_codon:yes gene_type:complete
VNNKILSLENQINQLPKFKLGYFPTPLYKCNNLEKYLSTKNLFIKRDDLSGLAFGGNKVRHLEFRIGDMVHKKYDAFINSDQKVSNNSRINAAACTKAGIKYVAVLSKSANKENQGNYLLQKLMNVEIHQIDTEDSNEINDYCKKLSKELSKEGFKPYLRSEQIFVKQSSIIGYISGAIELYKQIHKLQLNNIKIYQVAGNSVVGLAMANKYCDLGWEVNAISPYPYDSHKNMQDEGILNATEVAEFLDINIKLEKSDINYNFDFVGKDYGISTNGGINAIKLLAKYESIFLDPIYTSKCMNALLEHIKNNKFSDKDNIIFIHSGGTPNLFTYAKEIIANK